MTELHDQAGFQSFLDRFSRFYDALLVRVALELPHDGRSQASVDLLAQETANSDEPWLVITIEMGGVSEYLFAEGRYSHRVLSNGLGIHLLDGKVFLDLAPYDEDSADEADIRRSYQYILGTSCAYSVSEL